MQDGPRALRSDAWYAGDDRNAYIHRAWMRRGVPADAFSGRPQIAIANGASHLTPANPPSARGAAPQPGGGLEGGGVPRVRPLVSLAQPQARPTAMLWPHTAATATEKMPLAMPGR